MSFSGAEYLQFPPQSLSLRWYEEFFTSSKWLRAAANSLTIAVATMLVSTILGTLASIGITSKAMKKGGRFLNMLLLTPMIMPSIIAAIGMYMVYGQWKISGTYPGLVLAHSCLAIPMVVTLMSASLYGIDMRLYDAARSLGASAFTAVIKVILPLVRPALVSSLLFSFVTSFDETVVTQFIARSQTATLPKVIFDALKYDVSPTISAIASMLIALTIFIFALKTIFEHRENARRS